MQACVWGKKWGGGGGFSREKDYKREGTEEGYLICAVVCVTSVYKQMRGNLRLHHHLLQSMATGFLYFITKLDCPVFMAAMLFFLNDFFLR